MNFDSEEEWQTAMAREAEMFQMNATALSDLQREVDAEIAQLEQQRDELQEVLGDLRKKKATPLLEECASIAMPYLARRRTIRANNAAIEAAEARGEVVPGPDGKPLKTRRDPELKLLHRLTILARPAPLTPVPDAQDDTTPTVTPTAGSGPNVAPAKEEKKKKKSGFGGFLDSIKAKLQSDEDKEKERAKAIAEMDPEAQALCRFGMRVNHMPGIRFRPDQPLSETVEVASVSFTLRSTPPPHIPALQPSDADELAAYVNMTIHNAVAVAAGAAQSSQVADHLQQTSVLEHATVQEHAEKLRQLEAERAAAKRVLDSMLIDVSAEPVPDMPEGAPTAFYMTVSIRQRPVAGIEETVSRVLASEEYRQRREAVEKAYSVLELFALTNFVAAMDVGVAARPPPLPEDAADPDAREAALVKRRDIAKRRVQTLWRTHRELLTSEDEVVSALRAVAEDKINEVTSDDVSARQKAANERLNELIEAVRPPVQAAIDTCIIPAVRRTVNPQTANPEPLSESRVAANFYALHVRRAPREIVKLTLNVMYDSAAAKAEERARARASTPPPEEAATPPAASPTSSSSTGAAVKFAAAKAKAAAALAVYDDLHFDITPFPFKSDNQKKRAGIYLRRTEHNAANGVGHIAERLTTLVSDVIMEQRVANAVKEAEGHKDTALRDATSVLGAVIRSVNTLTGSAARGHRQLSRDTGRYDVTLCGCEATAPLAARIVVKPPPSAEPGVEAVRVAFELGLHPAPPLQRAFTGRKAGGPCRCDVFNEPLQILLADVVCKACDIAEEHSPLRDRFDV